MDQHQLMFENPITAFSCDGIFWASYLYTRPCLSLFCLTGVCRGYFSSSRVLRSSTTCCPESISLLHTSGQSVSNCFPGKKSTNPCALTGFLRPLGTSVVFAFEPSASALRYEKTWEQVQEWKICTLLRVVITN